MRIEYKISFTVFCLAFSVLFFIHLIALPFYWANTSQAGRPVDLYSPDAWTPAIIFYSILATIFVVLAYKLYSSLRKQTAHEGTIFITTFCLVSIGFWLFFALLALRWGHTMRLPSPDQSKTAYAFTLGTFLFSLIGAVFSIVIYEVHKLVRWAKKRLT